MDAREHILRSVRRHLPQSSEMANLDHSWIEYEDRRKQFQAMLEIVGGQCILCDTRQDVSASLQALQWWKDARIRCCLVPGLCAGSLDLDAVDDPHELANVDVAVAAGNFGVAENGAVWVTDQGIRHRAIFFIAQHLAIVLPASQIVDNMHQAYDRLQLGSREFGVFISGPSKTADIEQSLVIGAHGARSLTVYLVDE